MEKDMEIDMENYSAQERGMSSKEGLLTNRMKCAPRSLRGETTPGRNFIAKWFCCGYRPFMRCFFPWELVDFLLFFSFFALNALAFYLIGGFHHLHNLKESGKNVGTLMQWSFLVLLLPITRNGIFQWIFGCSWERVIVLHKWFARWSVVLMITHTIIFIVYYSDHLSEFLKFDIIAGEIAGALMIAISLLSLPFIRRRFFRIFMKSHYLLFSLILIFAALHKKGSDFLLIITPAIALYALDEIVRSSNLFRYSAHVTSLTPIGRSYLAIDLVLDYPSPSSHWSIKRYIRKMSYSSYQWANLFIPSLSFFQLHPFSFASPPLVDENHLLFIVKRETQWTNRLFHNLSQYSLQSHPPSSDHNNDNDNDHNNNKEKDQRRMISRVVGMVQVDGPYGSLTNGRPSGYGVNVLVSGGVGVTPNLSLFKSLVYENSKKNVNEKTKVVFVWSGRGSSLFRFFRSLFLPSLLSSSSSSSQSPSSLSLSSSPSPSPFSFDLLKRNFIRELTGKETANQEEEEGLIGDDLDGDLDEMSRRREEKYSEMFTELTSNPDMYEILLFQSAIDSSEIDDQIIDRKTSFGDDQTMREMMKEMSAGKEKTEEIDQFIKLGRPDLRSIFLDVKSYAKLHHIRKVAVYACGPPSLVKSSIRLSSNHSSPLLRFDVHHERFDI